jgi:phosphotransferase system IIB component
MIPCGSVAFLGSQNVHRRSSHVRICGVGFTNNRVSCFRASTRLERVVVDHHVIDERRPPSLKRKGAAGIIVQ